MKDYILMLLGTIKRIPLFLSVFSRRNPQLYIFGAWYGKKFADNSRALFLYACQNTNKRCVWICHDRKVYLQLKSKGLSVSMKGSIRGIYYQLTAGAAFSCTGDKDFCRYLLGNCVHVELWHGVGGGKTIGLDDREYRTALLSKRGRYYTKLEKYPLQKRYFVCTGGQMKKVFQSAFLVPENHFIMAGQPRNDMFYDEGYIPDTISKDRFVGKKVILYLPTHRKSGREKIEISKLFALHTMNDFCEAAGCVLVIKKHFYHAYETEALEKYPNIIDVTSEALDTNELLLLADYLISDYSSCTADYLLLDRPIFYYSYDYNDYISQDRDMYWSYDEITPGGRACAFEELLRHLERTIIQGEDDCRQERARVRAMFYDRECQCISSGKIMDAVERIVQSEREGSH